jgi:hypothetical protein
MQKTTLCFYLTPVKQTPFTYHIMVDAPGYYFDNDIYFIVWTRSNVTVIHRFHYAESDVKKRMTLSLTVRKIGEGTEYCFHKNNNIFLPVCVGSNLKSAFYVLSRGESNAEKNA